MNFTHGNHLTYTIGDRLFGYRENVHEKYKVSIGKIDQDYYKTSNWLNEQYRTADAIYKDFGKDFVVMFSGGTDSEIVLRAFLKIGIKPRAVFIKFKGDYNYNDYLIGLVICNQLGILMETIEFDVIDFYRSGQAAEFAEEIHCRQIAYLSVYHHIRKLGVPAVMGGEMLLRRQVPSNQDSFWYYVFRENEDASAMRFSLKYNIPLVNEWFSYTPEMMSYYLERPEIQSLVTERFNYKLGSVSTKNSVLYQLMPELLKKQKTTGYESLLGFNAETYDTLYQTHVKRLESSLDGIPLDDLKNMLLGNTNADN